MRAAAILLGALLALPAPAPAQPRNEGASNPPRRAEPAPRPRDPRDRAFMEGGMAVPPGGLGAAPPPAASPAPRPNLHIEPPRRTAEEPAATLTPTLINPGLPGRGVTAEGAVTQRESRLLETPAAGARLSVPLRP